MSSIIYGTERLKRLTETKEETKKRKYRQANKEAFKAYQRKSQLAKYGLTEELYWKIFTYQGGKCAICRAFPKKRRLAVDHDHATEKVRGLLCFVCNKYRVSGNTLATIQPVIDYLTNPPADKALNEPLT